MEYLIVILNQLYSIHFEYFIFISFANYNYLISLHIVPTSVFFQFHLYFLQYHPHFWYIYSIRCNNSLNSIWNIIWMIHNNYDKKCSFIDQFNITLINIIFLRFKRKLVLTIPLFLCNSNAFCNVDANKLEILFLFNDSNDINSLIQQSIFSPLQDVLLNIDGIFCAFIYYPLV